MKKYSYKYCTIFQALVQYDSNGQEVHRLHIPFSDLMKVASVCWDQSLDKVLVEKE